MKKENDSLNASTGRLHSKIINPTSTEWTIRDSQNLLISTNENNTEIYEHNSRNGYEVRRGLCIIQGGYFPH
jgi:hypothetical protein